MYSSQLLAGKCLRQSVVVHEVRGGECSVSPSVHISVSVPVSASLSVCPSVCLSHFSPSLQASRYLSWCVGLVCPNTAALTHTHHTPRTHTHTHTHTHVRTHARAHTYVRTHTRTHTCASCTYSKVIRKNYITTIRSMTLLFTLFNLTHSQSLHTLRVLHEVAGSFARGC